MLGSVTEVTAEHFTIKNDSGETYTVHFSVNTRIMKEPPGRHSNAQNTSDPQAAGSAPTNAPANTPTNIPTNNGAAPNSNRTQRGTDPNGRSRDRSRDSDRPGPETIKASDIKVGDVITAAGEVDAAQKSIGAIFIGLVDSERAKEMRAMEANYGRTWLAGRITSIDGTRITVDGMIDHAPHAIDVDENTSFRQRRDSITLADIKPGEQLRAEGALKNGVFLATVVNAMPPRAPDATGGSAQPPAPARLPQNSEANHPN